MKIEINNNTITITQDKYRVAGKFEDALMILLQLIADSDTNTVELGYSQILKKLNLDWRLISFFLDWLDKIDINGDRLIDISVSYANLSDNPQKHKYTLKPRKNFNKLIQKIN
jgi:hypothetical protein